MSKRELTFDANTPMEAYEALYKLPVGGVFRVVSEDYETVMRRIEEYQPTGGNFEVFPVNPGTELYAVTGAEHCVVVTNTIVSVTSERDLEVLK